MSQSFQRINTESSVCINQLLNTFNIDICCHSWRLSVSVIVFNIRTSILEWNAPFPNSLILYNNNKHHTIDDRFQYGNTFFQKSEWQHGPSIWTLFLAFHVLRLIANNRRLQRQSLTQLQSRSIKHYFIKVCSKHCFEISLTLCTPLSIVTRHQFLSQELLCWVVLDIFKFPKRKEKLRNRVQRIIILIHKKL